jgi:hypothetical protein
MIAHGNVYYSQFRFTYVEITLLLLTLFNIQLGD